MAHAIRKRVITARSLNGLKTVEVTIRVTNRERNLTRDEHDALTEAAASRVMGFIPDLPYFSCPLSKIKVTR